jgi:flagellin
MSVINTNVKALTAQASMSNVNKSMSSAMERLSTGSRINSAKDDAAGLAISLRMTSDIRGFAVAIRNANDGISLTQTAEGGLGQINDMLQRMRELAVQSSNGSSSADNRAASQLEVTQLKQEIDNIASRTNFNGIKLLDGSAAKLNLQTGVNAGDSMTVQIAAAGTKDLGLGARSSLSATGFSGAVGALKNIAAGDLTINGVAVGASSADDDTVSTSGFETVTLTPPATADGKTFTFDGVVYTAAASDGDSVAKTAAAFVLRYNSVTATKLYTAAVDAAGTSIIMTALAAGDTVPVTAATAGAAGSQASGATAGVNFVATATVVAPGGTEKSTSAIAKVAAINRISAQTGVTASVSATTVSGSVMTAAVGTGTIRINGVSTASFSTTADAGVSRANTAAAINLITAQTGVRAVDTGDLKKGVVLVADDGRNITAAIAGSTGSFTSASTGLGASAVTSGGYTLSSANGSPVVVGSTSNGTVANAGLSAGTYTANVSIVSSTARAVAGVSTAPTAANTGLLEAGTMKINGISIDAAITADDTASDVSATSSTKAASAIAIAAAINKKSAQTGVVAKAEPNVVVGSGFVAHTRAGTLQLNGTAIALSATTGASRGSLVTEINKYSGQTGVVASDNGSGLTMTAADGRNISMAYGGVADAVVADVGILSTAIVVDVDVADNVPAKAITSYSRVSLSSDLTFSLEAGSDGNANLEKLGFKAGTIGGANNGVRIATVNVGTEAGAQLAITALDAAMKSVSMSQAQLGAFQNRLDAVVSNLTVANLNMNASRSRIQDTDYATESTNLAKAQIISQAATAMLAQANQSGQSVLALLK